MSHSLLVPRPGRRGACRTAPSILLGSHPFAFSPGSGPAETETETTDSHVARARRRRRVR